MLKLLFVVVVVGLAIYATVRLLQRQGTELPTPRRRPRPPVRPQGPDDDDEFLRDLDRRRLHPEDPDG